MGWNPTGYSADVAIWLVCGERRIKLSHAGDTFVVPAETVNLPAGDAHIELTVDGNRFERAVSLRGGQSYEHREIPVSDREPVAPF
jgi:hypothetical protein